MSEFSAVSERVSALGADTSETHDRILDAAEALFGEKGFKATSVRDVSARARTSPGSINYYFGSKNGLIRAVIHRVAAPVTAARMARMKVLADEHGAHAIPLREILASFLDPLFEVSGEQRRESISRLLAQVTVTTDPTIGTYWTEILGPTGTIYVRALEKALPHLTIDEVFLRYQFFLMATYDGRAFSSWYWSWAKSEFDLEAVTASLEDRITMFASMFTAPGKNGAKPSETNNIPGD